MQKYQAHFRVVHLQTQTNFDSRQSQPQSGSQKHFHYMVGPAKMELIFLQKTAFFHFSGFTTAFVAKVMAGLSFLALIPVNQMMPAFEAEDSLACFVKRKPVCVKGI